MRIPTFYLGPVNTLALNGYKTCGELYRVPVGEMSNYH